MNNKNLPYNDLPQLPPRASLESAVILKKLVPAAEALARLDGACRSLPNPNVLVESLAIQEARVSSEIEHIVTTQDELYKALAAGADDTMSREAKEVFRYREALSHGMKELTTGRPLATNLFVSVMQHLKDTQAGIRIHEVALKSSRDKSVIYTPPVGETRLRNLLQNVEQFYHDERHDLHPLIRMAVAHYQFEAIHPFADGNGRTGRIVNILYLVDKGLLTNPVLYLSAYFLEQSASYYSLLQAVTEHQAWEDWVLFVLVGVEQAAAGAMWKTTQINGLANEMVELVRNAAPKAPARDLAHHLMERPYTKTDLVERAIGREYQTARKYLKQLVDARVLNEYRMGNTNYYINHRFMKLLEEPLLVRS